MTRTLIAALITATSCQPTHQPPHLTTAEQRHTIATMRDTDWQSVCSGPPDLASRRVITALGDRYDLATVEEAIDELCP